jgi:hypothetical protein
MEFFLASSTTLKVNFIFATPNKLAGKNDGSVDGVYYFTTKPNHGVFLRPSAVSKINIEVEEPVVSPMYNFLIFFSLFQ